MSVPLPDTSLASLAVGSTGTVSFTNAGVDANPQYTQKPATVRLQNESGSGLRINFPVSGQQFTLPAGGWRDVTVSVQEANFTWQILYNLPNPPVTVLYADYYYPNENLPPMGALGNSPIGIGGSVNVSNVNTLSNEGSATGTLVIDIGDVNISQLIKFFSDHFILQVDQSAVAHFVLRAQTSGNPVLLGQTGDTSEVAGSLLVDQGLTVSGSTSLGTTTTGGLTSGTTNTGALTTSGDITNNGGTLHKTGTITDTNDNSYLAVTASSNTRVQSGTQVTVQVPGGTNVMTWVAGQTQMSGGTTFRLANGQTIQGISHVDGAATGTYNHGYGSAPFFSFPMCSQNGSQTMGYDTVTSTQVHITSFSGLNFRAMFFG